MPSSHCSPWSVCTCHDSRPGIQIPTRFRLEASALLHDTRKGDWNLYPPRGIFIDSGGPIRSGHDRLLSHASLALLGANPRSRSRAEHLASSWLPARNRRQRGRSFHTIYPPAFRLSATQPRSARRATPLFRRGHIGAAWLRQTPLAGASRGAVPHLVACGPQCATWHTQPSRRRHTRPAREPQPSCCCCIATPGKLAATLRHTCCVERAERREYESPDLQPHLEAAPSNPAPRHPTKGPIPMKRLSITALLILLGGCGQDTANSNKDASTTGASGASGSSSELDGQASGQGSRA